MAQNWSLEQLVGECSEYFEKFDALKFKDVSFQFPDGRKSVALFNWPAMLEAIDAGNAEVEAHAGQLHGVHVGPHAAEQVDHDRWVPFGLVQWKGSSATDGYGAPSVEGTLYFDLLAVHKGQPTVLWDEPSADKRSELGLADKFFETLQES